MEAVRVYVGSDTSSDDGLPTWQAPEPAVEPLQIVMEPRLLRASCVLSAMACVVGVAVLVTDVIRLQQTAH